jgi:hypothetical protein
MLTWADVLADLRLDMKESDTPRLTDERAFLYLKFAIRDYSKWNPLVKSTSLDLDANGMAAFPTDFMRVIEVRHPDTHNIIPLLTRGSAPPSSGIARLRWWKEGNFLRMNSWADTPDTVDVLYKAFHELPASFDDATAEMTFPDDDEEAILLYIRAKDAGSTRSRTSTLDRFKRKTDAGNTRTDNPLKPEENELMQEYLAIMIQKYGSVGAIRLRK